MKSMKYQPGTFLEVDDLSGGRKVVLVGKDGVTFWDSVTADNVTPLVIHPVLKPLELGTLVHFVRMHHLAGAANALLDQLRASGDARQRDCLFVMRALWTLAPQVTGALWLPAPSELEAALRQAASQETVAQRIHAHAEQYIAGVSG